MHYLSDFNMRFHFCYSQLMLSFPDQFLVVFFSVLLKDTFSYKDLNNKARFIPIWAPDFPYSNRWHL